MDTRALGPFAVSILGLGCWTFGRQLDYAATEAVVRAALDSGVTYFDTADRYGRGSDETYLPGRDNSEGKGKSEEFLGLALAADRQRVRIGTKFGAGRGQGHRQADGTRWNSGGGERAYVIECVEASLRRLGTDYIDLLQMHEPDLSTPLEETLEVLDDLIKAGKVLAIGCSNFDPPRVALADELARATGLPRFISVQNQYSLLHRQAEFALIPMCTERGLALIPYFPLANGVLTGKYTKTETVPVGTRIGTFLAERRPDKARRFLNDRTLGVVADLSEFASARGHTMLDLAFGWLASHPVIGPIIAGASAPGQVRVNATALGWRLSPSDLAEVDAICGDATITEDEAAEPRS